MSERPISKLQAPSHLPGIAAAPAHELFDRMWRELNEAKVRPSTVQATRSCDVNDFAATHRYFTEQQTTKTVDLSNFKTEDEDTLEKAGIKKDFLVRNLRSAIKRRYYDSRAFQLTAIRKGSMFASCPFSGAIVDTRHSLLANLHTVFYRFVTTQVFYVVVARIGTGFEKCALYFPETELIVTAEGWWGFQLEDLIELKARMVSNFDLCRDYLAAPKEDIATTAVCLGFYHFAHHLWNELSRLSRLKRAGLLDKVDTFLVMREPMGKVECIFPEIPERRIERIAETDALFCRVLANRIFAVKVGGDLIDKDLMARANSVALENSLPATHVSIAAAKAKCSVLIWIGVRVGSRTWLGQEEGLAKIISSLRERFGRIGIVFDGFSIPGDRPRIEPGVENEYLKITNEENAVIEGVVRRIQDPDGISLYNIVGSSIFDAIVWSDAIDFYISSHGSLQHKVGWFGNKPGVIHANRTIVQEAPPHVWTAIENGVVPRYIRLSCVSDIPSNLAEITIYKQITDRQEVGAGVQAADMRFLANPEFDNYAVEWQGLLADFLQVVDKRPASLSAERLSYSGKVWLKNAAWTANSVLAALGDMLRVPSWFF